MLHAPMRTPCAHHAAFIEINFYLIKVMTHLFAPTHDFSQLRMYLSNMLSTSCRFLMYVISQWYMQHITDPFNSLLTSSKFIADNGLLIFINSIWIWILKRVDGQIVPLLIRDFSDELFQCHVTDAYAPFIPFYNNFEVLHHALSMLQEIKEYSLSRWKCKHFHSVHFKFRN